MEKTLKTGTELNLMYDRSSLVASNRYEIYMYGPAVRGALSYLSKIALGIRRRGSRSPDAVALDALRDFVNAHYIEKDNIFTRHWDKDNIKTKGMIGLKWAAKSASIPAMVPVVSNGNMPALDPYKDIHLPAVTNYTDISNISIDIVENEYLMWWQFLNALKLQFFNKKTFSARDSFHKLTVLFVPITDHINTPGNHKNGGFTGGNYHEFNSAVFSGIGDVKFAHDSNALLSYSISLSCPSAFQQSYKHEVDGLRDFAEDDTLYDFKTMKWRDANHGKSNTINYNIGRMGDDPYGKDVIFNDEVGGANVLKHKPGIVP